MSMSHFFSYIFSLGRDYNCALRQAVPSFVLLLLPLIIKRQETLERLDNKS